MPQWLIELRSVFSPPSADVLAVQELEDARRRLLSALSAKEYAEAMVQYHTNQVTRLTKTIKGCE